VCEREREKEREYVCERDRFRVQGSWFMVSGCRVQGAGFRDQGAGCRVQGSGFRFLGAGCKVQGSATPWRLEGWRADTARPPSVWEAPHIYNIQYTIYIYIYIYIHTHTHTHLGAWEAGERDRDCAPPLRLGVVSDDPRCRAPDHRHVLGGEWLVSDVTPHPTHIGPPAHHSPPRTRATHHPRAASGRPPSVWESPAMTPNAEHVSKRGVRPGLGTRWSHWLGIGAIGLVD